MPVTIFPGNMKYKNNNGQYHDITGLQGETGPQGPVGPRGETGSQGPRGETGSAGPQGEPGVKGETGDTGTTFTPAVSNEGVISWTNDGGKTNPSPVNIKGPKGDKGDPGDATIDDTAGVGDSTKVWSADKSATEHNSLLSAINVLGNGYFTPPISGSGYISREDGTVVDSNQYIYSDYVDVSGYDKLTTRALHDSAFNAFYDSSKNFVDAFVVRTGVDLTISIPANAVYMRVSSAVEAFSDTFMFKYLCRDNVDKINGLRNTVNILADQTVFIPLIEGSGYISRDDGSVESASDYSHSDYIDISGYDKLYITSAYGASFNAFYNASKTFISPFIVASGSNAIAIPENAVYIRVSNGTTKFNSTFVFKSLGQSNAVRIGTLEDIINEIENQNTDYFVPKIAGVGNISRDDGSVVTTNDYSYSEYVDILQFGKLITVGLYDGAFCAFYNASKTFIEPFTLRAGTDNVIELPENAAYMRVSAATTKYEDTFRFRPITYVNAVKIAELDAEVDALADSIAHSGDIFSPPSVGTGHISRDDGSIASSNYLHSDYIDISQYPKLITVAEQASSFNAFYKADKTFIGPFSIATGTDKIIEIPDEAMYMRVSNAPEYYAETMHFRTLDYMTSDALPDYWFENIASKCKSIRTHMDSIGKKGDTFIYATDIHWYRNQQISPKLIRYLLNHLNINMVALGGDLITEGTKDASITESWKCVEAFKFVDTFVPIDFGNHDNNSNQSDASQRFDNNTIYSLFMKGFEDDVTFMTDTEESFYFDRKTNKIRYIFLDMGDDGVSKAFTAYAEFRDALASTPSGYNIVIVAHIIDYGTFITSLTQMIDAYNARTTVTVNGVTCDFSSGSGRVILCLGGHRHYDDELATSGGVPITVTDCDAMLSLTSQTAGTITEQCFDVISIDSTNNIAYYERVGRGESRIIHLTPVSAGTLTTTLTGTITWSSGNDSIATVSNGTVTRVTTGTVNIKADNGTTSEVWVVI